MDVQLLFAKPVGVYDNCINRYVGKYCHCEVAVEMDAEMFCVIVDSTISQAYAPSYLEKILKRIRSIKGNIRFCFYILLNDYVDIRFFNDLGDAFHNPTKDVYDTINIRVDNMDLFENFIAWNLCQVGKPYDLLRACCLFLPYTIPVNVPDSFFCSQLVMHGLRELEIHVNQNINHMTPSDVYNCLSIKAIQII